MTLLVVDTSVAVKWVVPESGDAEAGTGLALALLERRLIAPDCLLGEFANALFKKVQRGEIGSGQARESIDVLPDVVRTMPTAPLVADAFELAVRVVHPVHDCIFLILALRSNARLVTADESFYSRCRTRLDDPPIDLLGEGALH